MVIQFCYELIFILNERFQVLGVEEKRVLALMYRTNRKSLHKMSLNTKIMLIK
jgi:hypothetical protein